MLRKGFRTAGLSIGLCLVTCFPVAAEESASDIADMMTWWESVGSDWDAATEVMDFTALLTSTDETYVLATNASSGLSE